MAEPNLRDWPSHKAEFTLPLRYFQRGQGLGTVILLHGYQDHALSMTRRMGWLDADLPFQILAINAPFPVPIWKDEGFVEAYSWYFRDTSRDIMIVHPATTAQRVSELVKQVVPAVTPLVLFGFSQGAYLAPFMSKFLPSTQAIITVGGGFPPEAYTEVNKEIRVVAVHGEQDKRWPLNSARAAHAKLLESGFKGDFHSVPGLDHRVDPILDALIRGIAVSALGGGA